MTPSAKAFQPQIAYHPGETLEEKLYELGMGPKEFAVRTGKPEKTIIAILKGKSSITPEMAIQFEQVLKIPAHFWLNKQRSFDEFIARKQREEVIAESKTWASCFPLQDMVKKGWMPNRKSLEELTYELLSFFSISSHTAWEDYYFKQQLKVAFRISLAHVKEPYAISAWLRQGEIQASALEAKPYDEKAFKDVLPEIKNIMAKHPDDFFQRLQTLCLKVGVKVVHTLCINKAPINGSTRWLNDTPLIQLTGRYKRNDIFWFTFFHEAGHILLHGKKDIFLENIEYSDKDKVKEAEADQFAVRWTLSTEEEKEITQCFQIDEDDVIEFAQKFHTHPAMIVGRLQHLGLKPYTFGTRFFQPVDFE